MKTQSADRKEMDWRINKDMLEREKEKVLTCRSRYIGTRAILFGIRHSRNRF